MSRHIITLLLLLSAMVAIAQVTRIDVNEGALPAASTRSFLSAGNNEFVALVNEELFHITMEADSTFSTALIKGAPDKLQNFHLFDFDLDGDLDLFAWRSGGIQFYYFQKNNGRFEHDPTYNRSSSAAYNLIGDDFDQDGQPELMLHHTVYRMTGPYQYETLFRYPLGNDYNYPSVHMTDVDRDGDTDLLFHLNDFIRMVINYGADLSNEQILYNPGNVDISWIRPVRTPLGEDYLFYDNQSDSIKHLAVVQDSAIVTNVAPIVFGNLSGIITHDLNGDGTEELILVENNKLIIIRYDYQAIAIDTTVLLRPMPIFGTGILFTESQEPLLLVADALEYNTYDVNSDFTFSLRRNQLTSVGNAGVQFIDVEGDNDIDVVQPGKLKRYSGPFTFDDPESFSLPAANGYMEDVDSDGDADFVSGQLWYTNQGDLTFGAEQPYPVPVPVLGNTNELLRADIDQDGDIDILTYKHFQNLSLLYNTGNGYYEDPLVLDPGGTIRFDAIGAAVSDINQDGHLDIIMATTRGLFYIAATGPNTFDIPVALYGPAAGVYSFTVADYNYDQYPDIVLSYGTGNNGIIKIYTGSAVGFTSSTFMPGNGTVIAAFADVDGQDWLDIVYHYQHGLWYATTLNGVDFITHQLDSKPVANARIHQQDVNADGKPDIILYAIDGTAMYYYLTGIKGKPGGPCPTTSVHFYNQQHVNQYGFDYGHCTSIPGDLVMDWVYVQGKRSTIKELSAFSNLISIEGDLSITYLDSAANLSGLGQVERIGGNLDFNFTETSPEGMGKLRYIGGDFDWNAVYIEGSTPISLSSFSSLDTIGGHIILNRTEVDNLSAILQPVINGNLMLIDMSLDNNTGFELVDTIRGTLRFLRTNISSLNNFSNLKYIKCLDLFDNTIRSMEILKDITQLDSSFSALGNANLELQEGFQSLRMINGDFELEAKQCNSLHQLDTIRGRIFLRASHLDSAALSNVRYVGTDVSVLVYVEDDFNRFSRLDTIRGTLQIAATYAPSLKGWENLRYVAEDLIITNNDKLRSISNLPDSLIIGKELRLYGNDLLTYCDEPAICRHLAAGKDYSIYGNGAACYDVSAIRCIDNRVSGIVYHDLNENLVHDPTEATLPNIRVAFNQIQDMLITSTNGFYATNASSGDSLHIEVIAPDDWSATNDPVIIVDSFIPGNPANFGNDVGLIPNFTKQDIQLSATEGFFVCSWPYDVNIEVFNKGTHNEIISVEVHYPEHAILDDSFTAFTAHDTINHILTIDLDTLHPFFSKKIMVPFAAPGSDYVGDEFNTSINVIAIRNKIAELVQTTSFNSTLLCAIDPNDKLVTSSNGSKDIHVNTDDALTYTVRFQNTGNFYATHVRVVDTISANVDMSTFTFIGSSHPVEIHQEGNVLQFNFYNILLPDSTTDLTGSQGYVTFTIQPYSQLPLGEEIDNDAHIYFDYNDAIITNLVKSVVVEITGTSESSVRQELSLFPNPVRDQLFIQAPDGRSMENRSYQVFTPQGQLVAYGSSEKQRIDVSKLPAGLFLLKVIGEDGTSVAGKFLKL